MVVAGNNGLAPVLRRVPHRALGSSQNLETSRNTNTGFACEQREALTMSEGCGQNRAFVHSL